MATGIRINYIRIPAVCFWMHIVLVSTRFYAKVLNSLNFSQRVMGYLEKYRIFVPELRRSLHIAKYRNEQKSARFHIVTYIIQANDQLLDFQSKSNLERVSMVNKQEMLISTKSPIGPCVECHNRKQLLNMCHIGAINVQFKTENYMK